MKTLMAVGLLLALSSPAVAREHRRQWKKPWTLLESNMSPEDYEIWKASRKHDHFFKNKTFWAGVTVIGAGIALDALSTATRPPGSIEQNPILGPNPSNRKIAGFALLDFGAQVGFHFAAYKVTHNDPSKAWRAAGQWAIPAEVTAINLRQGVKNYTSR